MKAVDQAHLVRQQAHKAGREDLAQELSEAITAYENKELRILSFQSKIREVEDALK